MFNSCFYCSRVVTEHIKYSIIIDIDNVTHVANITCVLGTYYIRFLASAVIIFVLIGDHYVHPLGLIIGLSVVVTSIIIATLNEIRKIIFKEAA